MTGGLRAQSGKLRRAQLAYGVVSSYRSLAVTRAVGRLTGAMASVPCPRPAPFGVSRDSCQTTENVPPVCRDEVVDPWRTTSGQVWDNGRASRFRYSYNNLEIPQENAPPETSTRNNPSSCILKKTLHSKNRLVETTKKLVDMCLTKLLVKNNQK